MGILEGAMKGAFKGLADVGTAYMNEGFKEDADARRLENARILQEDQYRLMQEREQNLLEFKAKYAEKIRENTMQRLQGAVGQVSGIDAQFDAARDAYAKSSGYVEDEAGNRTPIDMNAVGQQIDSAEQGAIAKAMQDPKTVRDAAMVSGEFDVAKALDGMGKEKLHNVPLGATVLGEDNRVVYDGSAKLKQQMQEDKQAADIAAKQAGVGSRSSSSRGAGNEVDKVYEDVRKAAKAELEDHRNPFADEGDEKAKDPKYEKAVVEVGARIVAKKGGSATGAVQKATEMVNAYDAKVMDFVNQTADALFDPKKGIRPEAAADFMKAGISTQDRDTFRRSFRDTLMSRNDVLTYLSNPEQGDKKFADLLARYKPSKVETSKPSRNSRSSSGIIKRNIDEIQTDPMGNTIN